RHPEAPIVDLDRDDAVRVARAPGVAEAARGRQERGGRLVEGPVEPALEGVVAEEEALQPHPPAGVRPAMAGWWLTRSMCSSFPTSGPPRAVTWFCGSGTSGLKGLTPAVIGSMGTVVSTTPGMTHASTEPLASPPQSSNPFT